jgi:uncharacterized protein YndB with AHSA1/START domain
MESPAKITVSITTPITLEKAWEVWTMPEHIINWNFASDDWCAPRASNDLKVDGTFSYRKVSILFESKDNETQIIQTFEAENQNPIEMQQFGWQAIMNNYKKYAESL